MSELGYLQSILLGILQGATEFLPISSSGHLVIVQHWFKLDTAGAPMLLFDVFAHLGTLAAVGIVFFHRMTRFLLRLSKEMYGETGTRRVGWRFLGLGVVATVPTAVVGLAFQEQFEAAFHAPKLVGACLMATGVMLAITKLTPRGTRGWSKLALWQALLIGFAQALAILPGVSRSGATICTALFCGWRRRWAVEFSFLIAAAPILGGTLIKLKDTFAVPAQAVTVIPWGPILVGSAVSLLVGVLALQVLLIVVQRVRLHLFAPYCWAVGALIFFSHS